MPTLEELDTKLILRWEYTAWESIRVGQKKQKLFKFFQQVSYVRGNNFRIPKTYFFFPKQISLTSLKTPLSLNKWIFKLLRLPCWWYSKLVPWDADRSWKGIDLIRSLSTEKTSKTCQNFRIFVWFDNCWVVVGGWVYLKQLQGSSLVQTFRLRLCFELGPCWTIFPLSAVRVTLYHQNLCGQCPRVRAYSHVWKISL